MKVNVRRVSMRAVVDAVLRSEAGQQTLRSLWPYAVSTMKTEALQEIARLHMHGRQISPDDLFVVLDELVRRREASGERFRTNGEALAEFRRYYMPHAIYEPTIPHTLTPSPGGMECLGNGHWPGYECQCPDCDWYATVCFQE